MGNDGYFPTFEKDPRREGQYIVHWQFLRWGLLTPIQSDWEFSSYGIYDRRDTRVSLRFEMVQLPPEPKTIHDNIILGDN